VLLEDAVALAGLMVAAAGVALSSYYGLPQADGAASILIGVLLILAAIVLARETRSLLTGESASSRVLSTVRTILEGDSRVRELHALQSIQLGSNAVLLAIALDLSDELDLAGFKSLGAELRARIKTAAPTVSNVFFKIGRPEYDRDDERGLRDAGVASGEFGWVGEP
jgi:divalent metal cation (Fe/Co/Zn/Cd) transporter